MSGRRRHSRKRSPPPMRSWSRQKTSIQYTLKVNHLTEDITESDLSLEYVKYGLVSSVKVVSEPIGTFAYVNFTCEDDALEAQKHTHKKDLFGTGTPVGVVCKWGGAKPAATTATVIQQQFTLKVINLSPSVTQDELNDICKQYNDYQSIKVNQGYAYVNFTSKNGADNAMKHLNKISLYGQTPVAKLHNTTAATPGGPASSSPPQQHTTPTQHPFLPHPQHHHPPHHHPPHHHPPHHHPRHHHPPHHHPPHHHPPHHHPRHHHPPHGHRPPPPHHHPPPPHHYPPHGHRPPLPHHHPPPPHHHPPHGHGPHHYSPPPPPTTAVPSQDSTSTTVKVTIASNDILSEDLEIYFSQFGNLLQVPIIRQGSPNYAFIYYSTNQEAVKACEKNKMLLKGVELNMKLSNKKLETAATAVVDSKDVKLVKCDDDPLIVRVLMTCLYSELELGQVTFKSSKDGQGIQLMGNEQEVRLAEMAINFKMQFIATQLTTSTRFIHCQYIPLFGEPSLFQDIEKKHAVQLSIVTNDGTDKPLLSLSSSVASLTTSSQYPITIESINEYLTEDTASYSTVAPVSWEYIDDNDTFTPMNSTDSTAVEKLYKSAKTLLYSRDKWHYKYDFINMTQTNVSTGKRRQIKRLIGASKELFLQIKCRGLPEKVNQSLTDLQTALSQNISEKTLCNCSNVSIKESLIELANSFCVEIDPSIDDKIILTSGSSEYLAKVLLILSEKQCRLLAEVRHTFTGAAGSASFPVEWEMISDSKNVELKLVSDKSSEWRNIEADIQKTIPLVSIISIERIQNKFLFNKYDLCKKRMSEKNAGIINEKRLFHGSKTTDPRTIYESEHGFDFRYGGSGMWGKGAYFAVDANYSKNYAYTPSLRGSKQMFMAYVLTGQSADIPSDSSLQVPPTGFDSVTGRTHGSNIYIVYDHDKSYPAYLITFYKL